MEKENKNLWTQAEYARQKGVSRQRVGQMIREKKLVVIWINGAKLIFDEKLAKE